MSGRVSPSRPLTAAGDIPVPIIADRGADAGSKELRAAASRNDADDEIVKGYPKLSKSISILFTAVLNVQSVVILLPSISEEIGITPASQQMVVSIYTISTGSVMLLWGRLADVYGRRLVYLLGSILFTVSNLCLLFTRYEVPFHIVRFLQGMSGATLIPSGVGIIASTFPCGKARNNNAYVCISAVASVGSVLGNIFGGVIGGLLSWQWVFWIPAILAGVTTAIAYFITDTPHLRSSPSASTSAENGGDETRSSLVLLLAAFTQANVIGWLTTWIPPVIAASVMLLVGFCFWQRRLEKDPTREPLLRISMFKNLQFSSLFNYLTLSELDTTLRFLPAGIAGLLISFVVSTALSRIRVFDILAFGLSCGIASPFIMAIPAIPPQTSHWAYGFPAICLCFSIEILWPPPFADQGLGSGLLQSSNNVGRALGFEIATAIQTSAQGPEMAVGGFAGSPGFLYGVRAAQWTNVGFAIAPLGIAVAFFRDLGRV
ncbi:putative MFS-type transporter [Colletotrichum shisoi]|uniref:Putative MFS-type transporter n=1 Tax=Colletotrichum shisoi TaxID=2078593 RepID=A0A5Q4BQQ1_9PEZI|nr:putative MFS-type transporter [Colletotrichum shisoi]